MEERFSQSGPPSGTEAVTTQLSKQGYAIVPAFFSPALMRGLRRELLWRDRRGEFAYAAIGQGVERQQRPDIRGDRTCWLTGDSLAQRRLGMEMEQLRQAVNLSLGLGLFELESHFAIYEPGAGYQRHLDTFSRDAARQLSVVLFLNDDWRVEDGGCLRLWPAPDAAEPLPDVLPHIGTLVCFLSADIPHQVCVTQRTRYSIAGWFKRRGRLL